MEFGKISLKVAVLLALALAAIWSDLRQGKIYNRLTVPVMAAGLVAATWSAGLTGLEWSLSAVAWAFLSYGALFACGALAAGDAKLLMAFGAWIGPAATLQAAWLGMVLIAIFGGVALVIRGQAADTLSRFWLFLLPLWRSEVAWAPPRLNKNYTIPSALPIALAVGWVMRVAR